MSVIFAMDSYPRAPQGKHTVPLRGSGAAHRVEAWGHHNDDTSGPHGAALYQERYQ
jgi:hypothetical protein